jgi:hypothetical protein
VVGPLGPEGAQVFSVSVDEQLVLAAQIIEAATIAAQAAEPATAANGNATR